MVFFNQVKNALKTVSKFCNYGFILHKIW